ncbi:MAG: O-antigen ligase family protein [Actinobacteria bacterium]|nr:MAG: O-antigen ligase family protein [Actinomycetota bacterium]
MLDVRPAPAPGARAPALRGGTPHLRPAWLLNLMFLGLFVWWALGVSGFVQVILAVPIVLALVMRGKLRAPRSFLLWVFFLVWMLVTYVQVKGLSHTISFGWRGSLYIAAGLLFLYVFNMPRSRLPSSVVVKTLAAFWVLTVIGGVIGMMLPKISFSTPFEKVLPASAVAGNRFVFDLVHASTASLNAFSGTAIHRPKSPFIYTNQWGSAFALSLPFALAALMGGVIRSRLWRVALVLLLVFSIAPLIFSLDRGSWFSTGVSMAYATLRLAGGRNRRMARIARGLIVGGIVVGAIVLLSPLWALIQLRLGHGYGDRTRALLYESSIQAVAQSPILGYGTPVSVSLVNPTAPLVGPSVGTHGQFWTIIVAHGIPGVTLFMCWWLVALFKTGRRLPTAAGRDTNARFWGHVAILAGIIQMAYYELIPWGLFIMMAATAMAWREATPDAAEAG